MKYVKMLSLAALAATALMALVGVGTASATKGVACSTASNPCNLKWALGTTADFSLTPGGSAKLASTSGTTLDTCTDSTIKMVLTENPNATGTATAHIEEARWGTAATPCNPYAATTIVLGKVKIEAEDDNGNGWLYADEEIEVTVHVPGFLGGPCIYKIPDGRRIGTWCLYPL